MTRSAQLILTAATSLAIGAGAATTAMHVTAQCVAPAAATASDDSMRAFLAPPDAPLNGYKRY